MYSALLSTGAAGAGKFEVFYTLNGTEQTPKHSV